MSSMDTMAALGEAFVRLTETAPIEKISVSDIVSASGKNRKTFYYHFDDKNHLVRWIFRNDLAAALRSRFDESRLVYESSQNEGSMPDLPYYAFRKSGVRSLDGTEFIRAFVDTLQSRPSYYLKALRSIEPDGLRAYLIGLYSDAFEADVRFILSNRSLDKANARFLAEFYAGALITYVASRLRDFDGRGDAIADMAPFGNIIHSSIESAINEQQLQRTL